MNSKKSFSSRFMVLLNLMLCLSIWLPTSYAQATYKFADRDTCSLYLDVYKPTAENNHCCVLFVFGGGFITGQRDAEEYVKFAKQLNDRGYTFVSIDYRLGLKGANMKGVHAIGALEKAVAIAVEDLFSATEYLVKNAQTLGFDVDKIVLCGSSAGAITVLQGDYELCNRTALAQNLPADFHFAGVIPFAGAIFSRHGAVKYKEAPAPTLFFHGIDDRLVTYKSIRFFNLGFFGANALVKRFEKFDYPYYARRYEGLGHEVAGIMNHEVETVDGFIRHLVLNRENIQLDATLFDEGIQPRKWGKMRPSVLY